MCEIEEQFIPSEAFHRIPGGCVRKTIAEEQFVQQIIKSFDPMTQELYRQPTCKSNPPQKFNLWPAVSSTPARTGARDLLTRELNGEQGRCAQPREAHWRRYTDRKLAARIEGSHRRTNARQGAPHEKIESSVWELIQRGPNPTKKRARAKQMKSPR
jgi:hypothetical protein